ncbi:hypothetical protein HMI55_001235 [Coelomomyces lativittatus]|nr:hypothetical protein HMI55_001235 [Coelomomyces lativittatus]
MTDHHSPLLFFIYLFILVSIKLFLHLIPLLCQSQPNAGTILLEALDAYSPVMKIPSLELKLGYLARIFGMVMETSELSILNFFQGALPPDVLVFFLAGLNYYIHTDYWFNQVQCLVLTLMEGNPTINSNQLHCGILVLIAALASPPWLIYTSTMEVFMSKLLSEVNQEKADSKVYCLAEVACVMLSEKIQSPASWYPCIWAARQLRDSSMLLCLIQNLFSLLTQHSCLTGTLLRFMSALPSEVLATVLRCEVTVQSVPYLLPKRIGPWSNLLRNSNELCEKLTMGLVVVANQIEFSILLPLIPFLITDNWTTNVMLLNTAWISLLENVDSHGWSLLQLICIKIPATHAMDKSLLFGMIATLSHHMRHRPSSVWLKTAIKDIVHTTLPVQNLWHALCHRINELWPKILPHYDLNQWAKLLQDPPKSNLITPEPNREAF